MIQRTPIFEGFVTGAPKGQPRPRAFSRGGKAAVYDPGTAEGWKSRVAEELKSISGGNLSDPLRVVLIFYFPRPKGHFNAKGLKPSAPVLLHVQKPDADNSAKAVLDAATIIQVWRDDDQVCDLIIKKRWAHPMPAGCRIQIFQLSES